MKNYQPRAIWLTLIVIVALLLMNKLPILTLKTDLIKKCLGLPYEKGENIEMRRVDLLGDLRQKEAPVEDLVDSTLLAKIEDVKTEDSLIVVEYGVEDSISNDSTAGDKADALHIVFRDTTKVPVGVVEIIDYGTESRMGMEHFYEALKHTKERPVRIGFFGDSFIEGDILTGWLRLFMQNEWGGKGVGYLEVAPETAGFRSTAIHRHSGFAEHQWLNKKSFIKTNQSICSHYYTTRGANAWVEGVSVKRFTPSFDQTSFYFLGKKENRIKLVTNDTTIEYPIHRSDSVQAITYNSKHALQKARWIVENQDGESIYFGMTMDGRSGISVDNLSMRGQSGSQLASIPASTLRSMHKYRKYDLIVLQFGLNVASPKGTDFSHYQREMQRVVSHMHEAYPEASILILSVGDRTFRSSDGQRVTMPGVKNLALYQQNVAVQSKIAYWSLFNAMKQLGGIDSMVKAKQANLDYTHINFKGGRALAIKLFEALKEGKAHYERKEAFIQQKRKELINESK